MTASSGHPFAWQIVATSSNSRYVRRSAGDAGAGYVAGVVGPGSAVGGGVAVPGGH
jgi:hypothetical protein